MSKEKINKTNTSKNKQTEEENKTEQYIVKTNKKDKNKQKNKPQKEKKKEAINKNVKTEETEETITEQTGEETAVVKKEEAVSIQEIRKVIGKKNEMPKEEQKRINKPLFRNIVIALCIIVYFIFLNLGKINIRSDIYYTDLKVFSICTLFIAIATIEKAYKKDSGELAVHAVEMIVLALVTISLIYVYLLLPEIYTYIVTAISYIFAIYYLIKCVIIFVKRRKKYFVDDMKDIIQNKEEE